MNVFLSLFATYFPGRSNHYGQSRPMEPLEVLLLLFSIPVVLFVICFIRAVVDGLKETINRKLLERKHGKRK